MMLIRNYVAASKIEGVGVFAGEPIKKGQMIWQFNPLLDQVIDVDIVNQQPEHVRDFLARYCYEPKFMKDKIILECDNGRFMNHSVVPNCDFTQEDVGFALRDIEQGEELTCNYAEFFNELALFSYNISLTGKLETNYESAVKNPTSPAKPKGERKLAEEIA